MRKLAILALVITFFMAAGTAYAKQVDEVYFPEVKEFSLIEDGRNFDIKLVYAGLYDGIGGVNIFIQNAYFIKGEFKVAKPINMDYKKSPKFEVNTSPNDIKTGTLIFRWGEVNEGVVKIADRRQVAFIIWIVDKNGNASNKKSIVWEFEKRETF